MKHPAPAARPAFTLIELLVVIAIIALLISILLPSLSAAREAGRTTKCSSNLRQLALASTTYAHDQRGYFSSGAWDNRVEYSWGPVGDKGWVADFVNGGYALPGRVLCPSSPAQSSQNLSDSRLNGGSAWRTYTPTEVKRLIADGYNTNYCQTWYMAHTDMRDPANSANQKKKANTIGPLADKSLGAATVSMIPLLGDGSAIMGVDTVQEEDGLVTGAKSLTDGPQFGTGPGGRSLRARQDYTDLGPVHAKGGSIIPGVGHDRTLGSIAFADAHVAVFRDTKRDGVFGSRTVTKSGWTTLEYDELEGKVFGGWLTRAGLGW